MKRHLTSSPKLFFALLLSYCSLFGFAQTYPVTNMIDDGTPGSLTYAIDQVNLGTATEISLDVSVTLTNDLNPINNHVTILGNGNVLNGGGFQGFNSSGAFSLTIMNLTIENTSSVGAAGALNSDGDVNLTNVNFNSNSGFNGGAINFTGNSLIILDCNFNSNHSFQDGGAINYSGFSLDIQNTTFVSNSSDNDGGAIFALPSGVSISKSYFEGNSATNGQGGAIGSKNTGDIISVTNSTFYANSSLGRGGAINASNGTVFDLSHITVYGNNTGTGEGALHAQGGPSGMILSYIISYANIGTDVDGNNIDAGTNPSLIGNTGASIINPDAVTDGTLDFFMDSSPTSNGGTGLTFLVSGSEVVNAGVGSTQTEDQAGVTRVGTPTLGALEINADPTVTVPSAQSTDDSTPISLGLGASTIADDDGDDVEVNIVVGAYDYTPPVDNSYVTLNSLTGVTITAGANNSGDVTISGSLSAVNAALNNADFNPNGVAGRHLVALVAQDNSSSPNQSGGDNVGFDNYLIEVSGKLSVGSTANSGPGSLYEAVAAANANPGPNTIDLSGIGTASITPALPPITESLTIIGPTSGLLTLNGSSPVFEVLPGSSADLIIMNNILITNGTNPGLPGGGIRFDGGAGGGFLQLDRVKIYGNSAASGGGVYYNSDGVGSYINESLIIDNDAASGAGIAVVRGTLDISNSTIADNTTGEGILVDDGAGVGTQVNLNHVTVTGNAAEGLLSANSGLATITYSILYGNGANDLDAAVTDIDFGPASLFSGNAGDETDNIVGTSNQIGYYDNFRVVNTDPVFGTLTINGDHSDGYPPSDAAAVNASVNGTVSGETIDQTGIARTGSRTLGAIEVNVDPVLTSPTPISGSENSTIAYGGGFSVTDSDNTADEFSVTITSAYSGDFGNSNGVIGVDESQLVSNPGSLSGDNSASVSFSGTLTEINNTLNSITFSTSANDAGPRTVSYTINDGWTGVGGAGIDNDNTTSALVAGTFVLSVTTDATPTGAVGSLRAAIDDANTVGGVNTIDATGITGNIALAGDLPTLSGSFTISGPGADNLTVNGGANYRIFGAPLGGGFDYTFEDIEIAQGVGTDIGALSFAGGGIYVDGHNSLTINRVHFINDQINAAGPGESGFGGGVFAGATTVTVNQSTFSGSTAWGNVVGKGGGIFINSNTTTANITNCTFWNNLTSHEGGAIWSEANTNLSHVTVNLGTGPTGSGIYTETGTMTMDYSIVYGNSVDDVNVNSGTFQDGGASSVNIIENPIGGAGTITINGTVSTANPNFGTYGDNACCDTPMSTLPIGANAIDAAVGSTETVDQRGNARPSGNERDLGALEMTVTIPTFEVTWLDSDEDGDIDQMQVDFSEAVDFTDSAPGAANIFAGLTLSSGDITTAIADFSTVTNVTTYTFEIANLTGTADPGVTVTYNTGTEHTIVSNPNGVEMTDGSTETASTDGASPVVILVEIYDNAGDGLIDDMVIVWSEDVDTDDLSDPVVADMGSYVLPDGESVVIDLGDIFFPAGYNSGMSIDNIDDQLAINTAIGATAISGIPAGSWRDATGNLNTANATNAAVIDDRAAPVVVQAITIASNENVDAMELQFSEPITDSEFTGNEGDWTLNDGLGSGDVSFISWNTEVTVITSDADSDDEYITLLAGSGIDGTAIMNYTYTNGNPGTTDIYGSGVTVDRLLDISSTAATDGANITLDQPITLDTNGDGVVDAMEIQFSEAVTDADVAAYFADFVLDDGASGNQPFTGFSTNVTEIAVASVANDRYVRLTINTGISGTGEMYAEYVNSNPGTRDITAFLNSEVLQNLSPGGNPADGAAPVVMNSVTIDLDGDGYVESLELEFSEPMDDASLQANVGDWELDHGLGGGFVAFDAFDTEVRALIADATADDQYATLLITGGVLGTGSMDYQYVNGNPGVTDILDVNTSTLAVLGDIFPAVTAPDGAPIKVVQALTIDADEDGVVDGMEMEFSEPVTDAEVLSFISDFTLDDGAGAEPFDGLDTEVTNIAAANVANDRYVTLTISAGITGTHQMTGAYTNTNPGTRDITASLNGEVLADLPSSLVPDGAGPVLLSSFPLDEATGVTTALGTFDLIYSEDVVVGTGNVYINYLADDALFEAVTDANISVSGNTATVDFQTALLDEGTDYYITTDAGVLVDGATVPNDNVATTNNTDFNFATGGAPKLANVVWLDSDNNGNIEQVILTFSTKVNVTDTDGAGGTGLDAITGINIDAGPDYGDGTYNGFNSILVDLVTPIAGTVDPGITVGYDGTTATNSTIISAGDATETSDGNSLGYTDAAEPVVVDIFTSVTTITEVESAIGTDAFQIYVQYSEALNTSPSAPPVISFPVENPLADITLNPGGSTGYTSIGVTDDTFIQSYDVVDINTILADIDIDVDGAEAAVGPDQTVTWGLSDVFSINTSSTVPTFTATWLDNSGNGTIDQLKLDFSTPMSFIDLDGSGQVFDALTITGGITITDNIDFSTIAGVNSYTFNVTGAPANRTDNPSVIITYVQTGNNGIFADSGGLELTDNSNPTSVIDGAAPVIVANTLQSENSYWDITFSEGVYNSAGTAITVTTNVLDDFDFVFTQGGGTATNVEVTGLVDPADGITPTAAGDENVRFELSITGIPDGNETIQLTPKATSVYDANGTNNPMAVVATGPVSLFLENDPLVFTDAYMDATNSYLIVEFSHEVSRDGSNAGNKEVEWRNSRGLYWKDYLDGDGQGGNSGASISFPTNTAMLGIDGNAITSNGSRSQLRQDRSGGLTGTPTGYESFIVYNPVQNSLVSDPDGKKMAVGTEIKVYLSDMFANDFDDASATVTYYDVDADGSIDEVVVVAEDRVDDASVNAALAANKFSIGANLPATSINGSPTTGITGDPGVANDSIFTLDFDIVGTLLVDPLSYDLTGNLMTDDAGNAFLLGGNITMVDAAGPIVLSATTIDSEPNGVIDQFDIVFSENIADPAGNHADFDLGADGTPSAIVLNGTAGALLSFTGGGNTTVVPTLEVIASNILDTNGNPMETGFYGNEADGAGPYPELYDADDGTIDFPAGGSLNDDYPKTYTSLTPTIGGTVDDPDALLLVNVDGGGVLATNNGDGTWAADVVLSDANTYDVSITTFDGSGNNGFDNTLNEILISGGATVVTSSAPVVCTDNDYVSMGSFAINENSVDDFSSTGNMLLQLPTDFFFDTGVIPTVDYNGATAGNGTFQDVELFEINYIGNAILQLKFRVDATSVLDQISVDGLMITATGSARTDNLTLLTSSAGIFGASTDGQVFGSMTSYVTPAALSDIDVTAPVGAPSNVTEYETRINTGFTLSATSALNTVTWYDYNGVIVHTGSTATDAQLSTSGYFNIANPGLYTFTVTDQTVNCESDALVVNILVYDDDDPTTVTLTHAGTINPFLLNEQVTGAVSLATGTISAINGNELTLVDVNGTFLIETINAPGLGSASVVSIGGLDQSFVTRTYYESDAIDDIYISNPAGHSVNVTSTGSGLTIPDALASPLLIQFDPSAAGTGGSPYTITYEITNNTTLETYELERTFTVQTAAVLFSGGPADEYCFDDTAVTITMNADVDGTPFELPVTLPYLDYFIAQGTRHNGTIYDLSGADLHTGTQTGSSFAPAGTITGAYQFEFDPADFTVPAGDFEVVYFYSVIVDDLGVKRIGAEDYFLIVGEPDLSITDIVDDQVFCSNEPLFTIQHSLTFQDAIDFSDPTNPIPDPDITNDDITNGYILYRSPDGIAPYTLYKDFTAPAVYTFNPDDPDQDGTTYDGGDLTDVGFFRIEYSTGALGDQGCATTATKDIEVYDQPDMPLLLSSIYTDNGGVLSFQNTDEYLIEIAQNSSLPTINLDGAQISITYSGATFTPPLAAWSFVYITSGAPFDPDQNGTFDGGYSIITNGRVDADDGLGNLTFKSVGSGISAGHYINWYDAGIYRYALVNTVTSPASDVKWFNSSNIEIAAYENEAIIPASEFGLNTNIYGTLQAEQLGVVFYYSSTSGDGCESEKRKVTVNVYGRADAPELDLAGTDFDAIEDDIKSGSTTQWEYNLDFCTATPGGADAVADNLVFPDLDSDQEYYIYKYYNADQENNPGSYSYQGFTSIDATTYNAQGYIDISTDAMAGGESYYYRISVRDAINGSTGFSGTTGYYTYVYVFGHDLPATPTTVDFADATLDFHYGEGTVMGEIFHTFAGGEDEYNWYGDNGKVDDISSLTTPVQSMNQATLSSTAVNDPSNRLATGSGLLADDGDDGVNDTYTYYVAKRDKIKAVTNFGGCESDVASITVTVHAKQPAPAIVSDNSSGTQGQPAAFPDLNNDGDGGNDDPGVEYYYAVCLDQVESTLVFTSSEATNVATPRVFRWYSHDGGVTRGGLLYEGASPTFADLDLALISSATDRYLEVIQVTDTDVFEGVEGESTLVHIEFFDQSDLTFTKIVDGEDLCYDDTGDAMGNITLALESESAPANAADLSWSVVSTPSNIMVTSGTGNPTIDLDAWHAQAGGSAVGNVTTTHTITMTYIQASGGCEITNTATINIHPDPDITFAYDDNTNGTADADPNGISLCYDDDPLSLEGILNQRVLVYNTLVGSFSPLDIVTGAGGATGTVVRDNGSLVVLTDVTGTFSIGESISSGGNSALISTVSSPVLTESTGNFSKTGLGLGNTVNNSVIFDPAAAHGTPYLTQSSHDIDFSYTDIYGCERTVTKTIYVNPRLETVVVTGDEIQFSQICEGSPLTAFVELVGISDYTNYTFNWDLPADATGVTDTDMTPNAIVPVGGIYTETGSSNSNEIIFSTATLDFPIAVTVTYTGGGSATNCSIFIDEDHSQQDLPDLDFTAIADGNQYCAEDTNVTLALSTNSGIIDAIGANTSNDIDDLTYSVTSYRADTPGTTMVRAGTGNPTIDMVDWHTNTIGGTTTGGYHTVHEITMTYTDNNDNTYQGVNTGCSNTAFATVTIYPDPDLSFTVNSVDPDAGGFIGDIAGDVSTAPNHFCYDDPLIDLQGVFASATLGIPGYNIGSVAGTFTTSAPGGTISNNPGGNDATFNPATAHGADPYAARSTHTITFTYTDQYGCTNAVTETVYVNPLPDPIEEVGGPQAGTQIHFDGGICAEGTIDAAVNLVGVTDYSDYTFTWNLPLDMVSANDYSGARTRDMNGLISVTGAANANYISYLSSITNSTANKSFQIGVTVTNNLTGCSTQINETHVQQDKPTLDFTMITDGNQYCSEDADVTLAMTTNSGIIDAITANTSNDINDLSYTVVSFRGDDLVTPTNTRTPGTGNPTIDMDLWHTEAGGNAAGPNGAPLGGYATYHVISMTYEDNNDNIYQNFNTSCSNSVVASIWIYPDPDLSILVNGANITDPGFVGDVSAGDMSADDFCYDSDLVDLDGVFGGLTSGLVAPYDYSISVGTGGFTSPTAGVISVTGNNAALFDPEAAHDEFHNQANMTTGLSYPHASRSNHTIRFDYTDEFGCANYVETTLYVNPLPDPYEVVGGTEAGDQIKFSAICVESPITAYVELVDPDTGIEVANYGDYTFTWTLPFGASSVSYNANEVTYSSGKVNSDGNKSFTIGVTVTNNATGCSFVISENHEEQDLPDLDFTAIADGNQYCAEDVDVTLNMYTTTATGTGEIGVDPATNINDLSYVVNSYLADDLVTIANTYSGSGNPTIDMDQWHLDAGGEPTLSPDGHPMGGLPTIHVITMTYQDNLDNTYQTDWNSMDAPVYTSCVNTVTSTITIYPDPDLSILVNGTNITDAGFVGDVSAGDMSADDFCYDSDLVDLDGVFGGLTSGLVAPYDYSISVGTGGFTSPTAGVISVTGNNAALFDPEAAHDEFHNQANMTTGLSYAHASRSNHTIRFDYTDEFGCANYVETTLYVNPLPDPYEVVGGTEAGDQIKFSAICVESPITAYVELLDPDTGLEVANYGDFTFDWSLPFDLVGGTDSYFSNSVTYSSNKVNSDGNKTFSIGVTVTNTITGCSFVISEIHEQQDLPELDFTAITDGNQYCAEDVDVTLNMYTTTATGTGEIGVDPATNISDLSYVVNSYLADDLVTITNTYSGSGNPTIDMDQWHLDADGSLDAMGNPVFSPEGHPMGGLPTVHVITMTYQDNLDNTYQTDWNSMDAPVYTSCINTVTSTITIYPDPDISFTVDGNDPVDGNFLGDAAYDGTAGGSTDVSGGYDHFCYDNGNVSLVGVFAALTSQFNGTAFEYDLATGEGVFSGDGVVAAGNNAGLFNPAVAHDLAYPASLAPEFEPRSAHTITYTYVDDFGCENYIEYDLYVNPLPNIQDLGGIIGQIQFDALCLGYDKTAKIILTDENGVEVPDYSIYDFNWHVLPANSTVFDQTANGITFGYLPENAESESLIFSIGVTVTNLRTGCVTVIQETEQQGYPPVPAFTYVGITENSPEGFDVYIHEDNPSLDVEDIEQGITYVEFNLYDELNTQVFHYVADATGNTPSPDSMDPQSIIFDDDEPAYTFNTTPSIEIFGLAAGTYTSELVMRTLKGCDISADPRTITILPVNVLGDPVTGTPYSEDFEVGWGGWYAEAAGEDGKADNRLLSWKRLDLGTGTEPGIGDYHDDFTSVYQVQQADGTLLTVDGGSVITTNAYDGADLDGDLILDEQPTSYYGEEVSYVYSPSFDMSQYLNPAMSFDFIKDFDSNRDGLVIQISDDDGRTWQTLGDNNINSGINWYSHSGIVAGPGETTARYPETGSNPDLVGYADTDDIVQWKNSRNQISEGDHVNNLVRFRFALASIPGSKIDLISGEIADGFAFDNFKIFEVQKIVLVEQFSSTLVPESKAMEDFIFSGEIGGQSEHTIDWETGNQGVWINYFTDVANTDVLRDPINGRNLVDPGTRFTYYGLTDVPSTRVAGSTVPFDLVDHPEDFNNGFNQQSLADVDFLINKNHPTLPDDIMINASDPDVLSVTTTFRAQTAYDEVEVGFYFAVVEKQLSVDGTMYYYALRKMISGPEGEYYRGAMAVNQEFTYTIDWPIPDDIADPDQLRVICFAQYYNHPNPTRVGLVDQAAWIDVAGKSTITTGLEDVLGNDVLTIYPNPADEILNLEIPEAPAEDVYWSIYDQSGREAKRGLIKRGTKVPDPIDTSDLPSGLYIIQLHNEERMWAPKKVLISH